jgi:DNA-binding MarR family transcriptional regulator
MDSVSQGNLDKSEGHTNEAAGPRPAEAPEGGPRRAPGAVRRALRATVTQLSLLNHQVGGHLEMRQGDLYCLDLIDSYGPLSPTALARMAGLHPATMTGVLDRLERGRWIARGRDPGDRRGILVRVLAERRGEILRLYAGMNDALDGVCAGYTAEELELIAGFLTRTAEAGRVVTEDLGGDKHRITGDRSV